MWVSPGLHVTRVGPGGWSDASSKRDLEYYGTTKGEKLGLLCMDISKGFRAEH